MDPNNTQNNSQQTIQNSLSDSIPEDVQYAAQDIVASVFERISGSLTDQDMQEIENLNQDDPTGDKVYEYLQSKVPQLKNVIDEEVNNFISE